MTVTNLTPIHTVLPRGGGSFDHESLREVHRMTFLQNTLLPALGMVLLGSAFTAVSHTYTATMTPRATADTPAPSAIFTDRACDLFLRDGDNQPVVAVEWQAGDLATIGKYRLQFVAVEAGDVTRIHPLPLIEVEVAASL